MKLFLDSEFTSLSQNSQLISLALVSEFDDEFYAEFDDYNKDLLSDWHQNNVISKLDYRDLESEWMSENGSKTHLKGSTQLIVKQLEIWLQQFETIEIWADVLAYDWVLFCELFGGALHIPKNIFFAPFDLSTLFKLKGLINPINQYQNDLDRFAFVGYDITKRHHALYDAKVEKLCYFKLLEQ